MHTAPPAAVPTSAPPLAVTPGGAATGVPPPGVAAVEALHATLERDGFVHVPGAIPPPLLHRLVAEVDEVYADEIAAGRAGAGEALHLLGAAARRPSFLELLDLPATFLVVGRALGWNLHVYHSHLDVHPPAGEPPAPRWGWHQDGGRLNLDLETHPRPRISLKVAFWLSDVSRPGRGNTLVLPGSHLDDTLPRPPHGGAAPPPPGAVELRAAAGDAVVLDRRLWHSRTANRSSRTRRAIFLAYAPRWLHQRDDHGLDRLPDDLPELTPVRRQLLGATPGPMDRWGLGEGSVPVRDLLDDRGLLDPGVPAHR